MRTIVLTIILLVNLNLEAQIFVDTPDGAPKITKVEKGEDSCSCQNLFYLISVQDSIGLQNCVNNGADVNCLETVEVRGRKTTLFGRAYTQDFYEITPIHFAAYIEILPALKILYHNGVFASETIKRCRKKAFSEKVTVTHDVFMFLSRNYLDPEILDYLMENGILSSSEKEEIDEKLEFQVKEIRENLIQLDDFRLLKSSIYSSAILHNQEVLFRAFENNIPEMYSYLVDVQGFDVFSPFVEYHAHRKRVIWSIFAPSGYSVGSHMHEAILNSNFPTIEMVEFGQSHGIITDNRLQDMIDEGREKYKRKNMSKGALFRKYYGHYFDLKKEDVSERKSKGINRRMSRIRKRLAKANDIKKNSSE